MRRNRKGKLTGHSSRVGKIHHEEWTKPQSKRFATVQEALAYARKHKLNVREQVSILGGQRLNVVGEHGMSTLVIKKEVPDAEAVEAVG